MKKIFDRKLRTYGGPKGFAESFYLFMDRSNREHFVRSRRDINRMWKKYSAKLDDSQRVSLWKKLRSHDDEEFLPAFSELLLLDLLSRNGLECVYEALGTTARPPDFKFKVSGAEVTLEVVTPSYKMTNYWNTYKLIDVLNSSFTSDKYHILLTTRGYVHQVNKDLKHIKKKLHIFLEDSSRELVIKYGTTELLFEKLVKKDQKTGRFISMNMSGMEEVLIVEKMRNVYKRKKARSYGLNSDEGYILVMNMISEVLDEENILDFLWGDLGFVLELGGENINTRPRRRQNGVFNQGGKVHPDLTGIVICNNVTPLNFSKAKLTLYLNPFAKVNLPLDDIPFQTKFFPKKGGMATYRKKKTNL